MTIGARLRDERKRLGLNQTEFAAIAGTTKQTLFSWETGKTAPDGFQLEKLALAGVNVQLVLTGDPKTNARVLDRAEEALIDSYRQCSGDARINLIQTAALFAAGVAPKQAQTARETTSTRVSSKRGHAAGRDVIVKTEEK